MANRDATKTAMDVSNTDAKADIDTTLPLDANVISTTVISGSRGWVFTLDARGDSAKAATWKGEIVANLTTEGKDVTVQQIGRRLDDTQKEYLIVAGSQKYFIKNA